MWVHTAQGDWVVPPNRAVWVPAGIEHGIEMTGKVLVQTIYLAADVAGELPRQCCAVNVSPLLRELIVHTVKLGMLDAHVPSQARLIAFLIDQLSVLPAIPLQLPLPAYDGELCRRMASGAPGRARLDQIRGQANRTQRQDARADLPERNRHDFRQVAAATAAPAGNANAGGRPAGHRRRPRRGV